MSDTRYTEEQIEWARLATRAERALGELRKKDPA